MVATLSVENTQIPETISTCRFAQTVAAIPNKPVVNEAVKRVAVLSQLAMLSWLLRLIRRLN